jgi:hypothetical protein
MRSHKEKRILKDSESADITVSFAGETFVLKNAFIGGRNVADKNPVGVYSGVLDVAEMGISLLSMFRAILRTTREEMGMPTDTAEDFILFTLAEAIKRETEEEKMVAVEEFVNKFFGKHL